MTRISLPFAPARIRGSLGDGRPLGRGEFRRPGPAALQPSQAAEGNGRWILPPGAGNQLGEIQSSWVRVAFGALGHGQNDQARRCRAARGRLKLRPTTHKRGHSGGAYPFLALEEADGCRR